MLINKYHIEGEVAYLELTQGQVTMIDVADLEKALTRRWHVMPNSMGGYYVYSRGLISLHRFLLDAPKGKYVDHINHDTLDNRRSNLRIVSNQKNNTNREGAYVTSKTGIRGVSVHRCKPSGFLYVFKCSCVTCKACEYFPYTDWGLEEARRYAEWHYAAMEDPEKAGPEPEKVQYTRIAPIPEATGKIDAVGVSIAKTTTGTYYFFRCRREVCPKTKYFPLTEEGLEAAKQYSQEHYAAYKEMLQQ